MKALLPGRDGKSKASIAISIAVHALLFVGLAAITFHYPIAEIFGPRPKPDPVVPIRYVRLTPRPTAVAAGPKREATRGSIRTAPLPVVTSIPVGIPAPAAPTAATGIAIGDPGRSTRVAGVADGLRPGIPDARLSASPMNMARAPETEGQKAERALAAIYNEYLDSARVAIERQKNQREPGDWSWGGSDSDKWGWDKNGIHVGGITIPNLVLAALPLNVGLTGRNMNAITDARADAYMRNDIKIHAGMMTETEFRTAVRRIRDRVDRERQERLAKEAAKQKPKPAPCCG